jgi:SAM-dependent methyltransferase
MDACDAIAAQITAMPAWHAAVTTAERIRTTIPPGSPKDGRKFLNLDSWLRAIIRRTVLIGLHRGRDAALLDLGTGTGIFPFVCRHFGHQAIGFDLPADALRMPEREIFTLMPRAFNVPVVRSSIRPFAPLEISGRYDFVTAFLVTFNNHKRPDEWGQAEWQYFVEDVATHLKSGGRLVLMLNSHEERYGASLQYYDHATRAYFASVGRVFGATVIIGEAAAELATASNIVEDADAWQLQRTLEAYVIPTLPRIRGG